MVIHTQSEYQDALHLAEGYYLRGVSNLSLAEKEDLNKVMKAIESYQFRTDPLTVVTDIP